MHFLLSVLPYRKSMTSKFKFSFPTEELSNILKTVDDLDQNVREKEKKIKEKDNKLLERGKELLEIKEQRQVLEQQLLTSVSPFCVLPPKLTHEITGRDSEVSEITQELRALKSKCQ